MMFNRLINKLKPISLGENCPRFILLKSYRVYNKNNNKLTTVIIVWKIGLWINIPIILAIINANKVTNKYLPILDASLIKKKPTIPKAIKAPMANIIFL